MLPQITLTFLLALTLIEAVPPPGHKKKSDKPDENPPKYEYEYKIQHAKGTGQGKTETRDGELASGSYYVEGKDSSQKVEYVADDWGYHPYVEYTNVGPHSKTVTQIALDTASVKALKIKNTKLPGIEGIVLSGQNKAQLNLGSNAHQNQLDLEKSSEASRINIQHHGTASGQEESSAGVQQQNTVYLQQQEEQSSFHQRAAAAQEQQLEAVEHALEQVRLQHPHADAVQQALEQAHFQHQQANVVHQGLEQAHLQQQTPLVNVQDQGQHVIYFQQQQQQQQQHNDIAQQTLENNAAQQQASFLNVQEQHSLNQEQEEQHNDVEHSQSQHQTVAAVEQPQNPQPSIQQQQFSANTQQHQENSGRGRVVLLQQQGGNQFIAQQQQQPQIVSLNQQQDVDQQGAITLGSANIASSLEEQARILFEGGSVALGYNNDQQQQNFVVQNQPQANILLQQVRYETATANYPASHRQEQAPIFILQNQNNNQQQHLGQVQQNFQKQEAQGQSNIQFETAALYESSGNKLISQHNSLRNTKTKGAYGQTLLNAEHPGGYGSKINVKITPNSRPLKFVHAIKRLVTGQDVLNINRAINQNLETASTTAATAIVSEYAPSEASNLVSPGPEAIFSSTSRPSISSTTENSIQHSERIKISDSTESDEELALSKRPIVVADFLSYSENGVSSTEGYSQDQNEEIVVTPRPVSSKFLAPLTAGVQLQASESQDEEAKAHQNIVVDIQKSIPYYLGKIEYYDRANEFKNKNANFTVSATQNILLGGFLQHPIRELPKTEALVQKQADSEKSASTFSQALSSADRGDNSGSESVQAQEQSQQVAVVQNPAQLIQSVSYPIDATKVSGKQVEVTRYVDKPYAVHVPVHIPVEVTKVVERPVEVTKYVDKPYAVHVPVHIPIQVPVTVEKRVPVPVKVEVEKIVEKPVTVTKIIERKVPVPHPVEKRVEVPVTKYIDRPYAVPYAVPKPVPYPVEVEKIVERIVKQPYPVAVQVPVQVPVPHPVQVTVEKKVPYPQYIEKRIPVEKIVPQYISKPYPVAVQVPVHLAQAFYVPVEVPKPYPVQVTKYVNKPYAVPKPYPVQLTQIEVPVAQPVPVEVRVPHPVFFKNEYNLKPPQPGNGELAYAASYQSSVKVPCVDLRFLGVNKPYCGPINNNNYIGLVPPKMPFNLQNLNSTVQTVRKQRTAKQSFDESNIRLEYGFMPPLIPSLAIDEEGNPVEKHTK